MQNCKAAIYNPANACTDRCKWPGVCKSGVIIRTIEHPVNPQIDTPEDVSPESVEVVPEPLETAVDIEAASKPKRGRKIREDA
jgi:hypothetical protein